MKTFLILILSLIYVTEAANPSKKVEAVDSSRKSNSSIPSVTPAKPKLPKLSIVHKILQALNLAEEELPKKRTPKVKHGKTRDVTFQSSEDRQYDLFPLSMMHHLPVHQGYNSHIMSPSLYSHAYEPTPYDYNAPRIIRSRALPTLYERPLEGGYMEHQHTAGLYPAVGLRQMALLMQQRGRTLHPASSSYPIGAGPSYPIGAGPTDSHFPIRSTSVSDSEADTLESLPHAPPMTDENALAKLFGN